ncbi:ABC transporter ATP-binding protein [Chryseobacterium sp. NKUCC03_KSP]|uniref:ABC transporter ATP-binding protein n=1 Tax=Chryseobacterium sp. NKUCC03_KSP TaxID=2842125 RepID=UPI001C5B8086|nr:ABC transporter ATP-binding protein [Chryseobacterium sp. NKUCC03_KSP]MBW3520804.1 ABC transporter ATP-binding protein [Chryseobacterium sp. NKUCC03_KSP]
MLALKAENISKQYRLGQVGTGTLTHDLNRFWHKVRGKENPYLKIGESNDRSTKGSSDYVWSLRDINFEIEQGDAVGIIGRNGAGKSTLLKLLSKVTKPTTGKIYTNGRIASLLEVGTGFHPEMTGRENVYLNGAILGMTKKEITRKFDEIVDFSGVERYIDTPVKRYSSGMYVRLAFAVAAHLESEILIVDEVLAVGDAEFQKKCLGKMGDVSKGEGRTVLFVSHNMTAIERLCTHSLYLKNGKLIDHDITPNIISKYISEDQKLNSMVEFGNEVTHNMLMHKVWLENINEENTSDFFSDEEIFICMKFTNYTDNINLIQALSITNEMEIIVLASHDLNPEIKIRKKDKTYIAKCKIPSHFLNEGTFTCSLGLIDGLTYQPFVFKSNILKFRIKDRVNGISARGLYTGAFPGIVRPILNWETK